jgi:hypothetical protein
MFFIALVLFGKDLFQPLRLLFSNLPIHRRGIVAYKELLATTVTPEGSHFLQTVCLSRLVLFIATAFI